MPCYLTGSAEGDARLSASESAAEVTKLAALLCSACESADKFDVGLPYDVQVWWNEHKKVDAERLRRENEELERIQTKAKALAKLSGAERRSLGL